MRPLFDAAVDPRERLRQWFEIGMRLVEEMPLTSRLLGNDREILAAMEEMDPAVLARSEAINVEVLADMLAAANGLDEANAELRERAKVLISVSTATLLYAANARHGLSRERFAKVFADMIIEGLA